MQLSTQSITTEWFTIGRKFGTSYAKMLSMVRQPFLYVCHWLTNRTNNNYGMITTILFLFSQKGVECLSKLIQYVTL